MKNSVYKAMKLKIFENAADNVITESQRDDLLAVLEAKKADTELTPAGIKDFLEELAEKYPDLEDDIEKLQKKLDKADESGDDDDEKDDDASGEEAPAEDDGEENVSEAVKDLIDLINSI